MVFACDVETDVVVTGGIIGGTAVVVYYNFFTIFKFIGSNINILWNMTKNETTVGDEF